MTDGSMKIGLVGAGHVGLVTAVSFAEAGHQVVACDADPEKVAQLRDGRPWFHEPGLEGSIRKGLSSGRLRFTDRIVEVVEDAEAVFICVGTPPSAAGDANLVAVERSVREVARYATSRCLIVEKSTVPTGTARRIQRILDRESQDGAELEVVSNPEFLREGQALEDALHPDRILIGAESEAAFETMRRIYAPLVTDTTQVFELDIATAELTKYGANAFLALKISFINALARLCELAEGDVVAAADVIGSDPRIGRAFLDAGLGYGGSCFPKDLLAFDRFSARLGYDFPLLREIARINDEAVQVTIDKVKDALWHIEGKRIGLLGLSFKPGTDDVRFSPGLRIAARLVEAGARVAGYDPLALANAKSEVPELEVNGDPYEAAAGSSCVIVCTEWDEIRNLDLARLKESMSEPVVVDGRNVFSPRDMQEAGFSYYPVGRPSIL